MLFQNRFLRTIDSFYSRLIHYGSNLQSLLLFWLRLTWGHQLMVSGIDKLNNIPETIQFFTSIGVTHPVAHAYIVGSIEATCGFLFIIGFLSRLAAIPLICVMFAALTYVHNPAITNFGFIKDPISLVHERPYPFLITSFLILLFGPGRISIDALIKNWADRQPKY